MTKHPRFCQSHPSAQLIVAPAFHCPFCHRGLEADTDSGEEFSCRACAAMVDVIDDDLTMVSRAPHSDVFYIATSELRMTRAS